jgi:hypothetical protein
MQATNLRTIMSTSPLVLCLACRLDPLGGLILERYNPEEVNPEGLLGLSKNKYPSVTNTQSMVSPRDFAKQVMSISARQHNTTSPMTAPARSTPYHIMTRLSYSSKLREVDRLREVLITECGLVRCFSEGENSEHLIGNKTRSGPRYVVHLMTTTALPNAPHPGASTPLSIKLV